MYELVLFKELWFNTTESEVRRFTEFDQEVSDQRGSEHAAFQNQNQLY